MGSHGRVSMSNFRLGKLSSDGPCCDPVRFIVPRSQIGRTRYGLHMPPLSGLYTVYLTS